MKTCNFSLGCLMAVSVTTFLLLDGSAARAAMDARMDTWQGAPAIMVNGQAQPPMTFTIAPWRQKDLGKRKDYLGKIGATGLKIHYVGCKTRWLNPGNPEKGMPDGIAACRAAIRQILDAVPDAYVILRLNVSPPASWINAHPEEQVLFSDGTHRPVICTSVGGKPIDGMHSLCSKAWMAREDEAIAEFFAELGKTHEFEHVIGTFLCAAGTGEWYYPQALVVDGGKAWGDCSEPFRAYYEGFLRRKYGTVEELRRVWKRPEATFEHPIIPTAKERDFIEESDAKILDALRNWENAGRVVGGKKIDVNAHERESVGVFLNANGHAHVADFFTAWHESTAATVVHFAKTLKRLAPNRLVGAFYGAYGCQSYFDGSTASGTRTILDSGVVDFLAAPGVYNNREPGGHVAQREMQDSFRLRNMIFISEEDSRTHLTEPWIQRDASALYDVRDSIDTLKRDFARNLCEDTHAWWFDMGPFWYDDPDILALFTRQQAIAREAYAMSRVKHNDIALVYDSESLHYVSQPATRLVVDYWRTTDLARIGAPVDYYFHNDLANPRMPDYKLYVMLNQYCLTDEEREAVYAKARKNGATILWMYAPGFVNPKAEKVMDVANVEKTVGMRLGFIDKTFFPHFRVDPKAHPALGRATASRRYGVIDRDLHSNVWVGTLLTASYQNPGFYIDDPAATVLGRYCCNGKPALAMVEKEGVKSVYCATQVMRSDLLASLAAWTGCHIYGDTDDILYANENCVTIHASSDGKKTIRFKRLCSPFEVYEQRAYGEHVDHITVDMRLGETKMWQLR